MFVFFSRIKENKTIELLETPWPWKESQIMQSSQLASWENPWQNLTVIFWNIIKLSVFLFRNTCSTGLAHILVQELSRFCFRELNPIREINADNKFLLLTMAHREIFGKKRQLSQFDGSFNEHGFYVLTNTNTYMNLCIYCQKYKNITLYRNYQNIKMHVVPEYY